MEAFHIIIIIIFLIGHWIGDFVLQSNRIATGKSKNVGVLLEHVTIYTITLLCCCMLLIDFKIPFQNMVNFAIFNGILHFCVDFITSKITSRLWGDNKVHEFFVVVGLDQLLHMVSLIITINIFLLN